MNFCWDGWTMSRVKLTRQRQGAAVLCVSNV